MDSVSCHPLAEVFGFPISNDGERAVKFRSNKLCPFGNVVPNCTKDKVISPLGVCSIYTHSGNKVITCPVRFREDWEIIKNAAKFVFPDNSYWTSLSEVKLLDGDGRSAGNIDYVLVRLDKETDQIIDFASVEVQGVYVSGNLRSAFESYIKNPSNDFSWNGSNYPHPDFLSSSRKRLAPQMLYKGGIFKSWGKKQCVVLQEPFFRTLPELPEVPKDKADIAWFIYDLEWSDTDRLYHLALKRTIYTEFSNALNRIVNPNPGNLDDFMSRLQVKLNAKKSVAPETPGTVLDII